LPQKKQEAGQGWPIENVERRATDELVPYARNARTHSDQQVDQIAASIAEWGWTMPVLIDEGGVILAGHGRVLAARRLGIEEVPVIVAKGWSEPQRRAYVLADNKLTLNGGWDEDLLRVEIADLELEGFDLDLIGFDKDELATFLDDALRSEIADVDDAPEPPVDPITKPGDLWLLGEHRLLCGDSTKAEDVERLMAGAKADLMLTDPPYNVALGMNETPEQAKARNRRTDGKVVANDSMSDHEFRAFLVACFEQGFSSMKPGASFYVWHADSEGFNFRGAVRDCGQKVRQCLVWAKDVLVMGRQDYQWQHEPCLYGWKDGAAHGWYSDRKQTTLLRFDRPSRNQEHPTMKPVGLFAYLMGNSTAPQGLAYDPFLGSGTTLIAAEQLGRKCYGIEISPAYCDVIVKRWEQATDRKATLEDGRTLDELHLERSPTNVGV
jgi:DNA modification methylase